MATENAACNAFQDNASTDITLKNVDSDDDIIIRAIEKLAGPIERQSIDSFMKDNENHNEDPFENDEDGVETNL